MLACNGHGLLSLLTILELLFEPTLVSDCSLSPSGKNHCSGSDQSSAALNRDRDKKIRIGHALPTCHQSRQAHHLALYAMDLNYLLQRFSCPQLYFQETAQPYSFRLICSTFSLPFTTYLTDQILARCKHCLGLDKQPIRHSNFLKCRFIFLIFWNAWVCWRIIINIGKFPASFVLFPAIWQQLAVAVSLCLMTGSNTRKAMNTNNNLRNGQNHASVSCSKQFHTEVSVLLPPLFTSGSAG